MKPIYCSTDKEDSENFASGVEIESKSIGKPIKTEIREIDGKFHVFANGKICIKPDVKYFEDE